METVYHEVCLSPTLDFQEPSSEVVPRTTMPDPHGGEKGEETVMTVVLVSQLPLLVARPGRRNEKSKLIIQMWLIVLGFRRGSFQVMSITFS